MSIDDLLSIPVKKIEALIDYLIQNKSYMGKRMMINALKKFYEPTRLSLRYKMIKSFKKKMKD